MGRPIVDGTQVPKYTDHPSSLLGQHEIDVPPVIVHAAVGRFSDAAIVLHRPKVVGKERSGWGSDMAEEAKACEGFGVASRAVLLRGN